MTTASDLDQRITFDKRIGARDTRGALVYTYEFFTRVYAQSIPLRGREFFAAGQNQEEVTTRFRIRYCTWVDPSMRITWRSAYYDIVGQPIEVDGGHEWIDLMCKSGVSDGR